MTKVHYSTIHEIRRANARRGHHFFEPEALEFFSSVVLPDVIGGRFFITSERYEGSSGPDGPRLYTVREARPDGSIRTVGEHQGHATAALARRAAREQSEAAEGIDA